ncbi:MAG: C13 family peptidase [Polaromonas sp.]|nr:C13 family peptidase [Polaromonas sp.]MDP3752205.1 C13 family peptidase [Polaromonas sp.]
MHDFEPQATRPGLPHPLTDATGPAQSDTVRLPTLRWIQEGLRAAFFQMPRIAGHGPAPAQMLAVAALVGVLEIALLRLEIVGPARFDAQAWLSTWWLTALGVGLAWWVLAGPSPVPKQSDSAELQPAGLAAFLVLWLAASLPNLVLAQALIAAIAHGWIRSDVFAETWFYWTLYGFFTAWSLAVSAALILRFAGWNWRAAVFLLALLAATGLNLWQFEARTWDSDPTRSAQAEDTRPRLRLSQETLEAQQVLWQRTVDAIATERPGVADVYGLVFAPYAAEDVFLRESTLVSRVLAERFDAEGRVIHLLNHAGTALTHPWATPLNLQRAIEVLAQRMDRENDVLVVYLTSHGARDFKLAASHWPLEVPPLSPGELRAALDKAGIRHRVIAVSACYSGGWIDQLADDNTLVMTAADATHTSYGCGRLSELTFFGRAMFDEQLRNTLSFEQAFARAVPVIRQREIDAGKNDGFSNPQIKVGANMALVLQALERRLAALPFAAPALKTVPP